MKKYLNFLKSETTWIVCIFVISFTLRMIYMAQNQSNPIYLSESSRIHYQMPRWFQSGALWRSPTVPWMMHGLFQLLGRNWVLYRLAFFVLGSINSVLVYYLAKRIFNPAVARIASLITSIYVPFIFFEGGLLDPPFDILVSITWFMILLKTFENPTGRRWFLCGIFWSLATLGRQHFFLFGIALIVYLIISFFNKAVQNKKNLYYAALFFLGFAMIIGYIAGRNAIIGKDFVLVGWADGAAFHQGNCLNSDQLTQATSWFVYKDDISMPYREGHVTKHSEYARFFYKKGFEFIFTHPIEWLQLLSKRFFIFWNGHESMSDDYIYGYAKYSPLVKYLVSNKWVLYPFGIIGPLAIIGMVVAFRESFKAKLLVAMIVFFIPSAILFTLVSRLKAPIVPFIIVAASYTIWWWYRNIVTGNRGKDFFVSLSLFAILFIPCNFYYIPVDSTGMAYLSLKEGWGYLKMKNIPAAIASIEKSAELYEGTPDCSLYLQLASLYGRQKDTDKAIKAYEKAMEIEPTRARGHLEFAKFLERIGRIPESVSEYSKAESLSGLSRSEYMFLYYKLANMYEAMGRADLAIGEYKKIPKLNPRDSYLIKEHIEAIQKNTKPGQPSPIPEAQKAKSHGTRK